MTTQPAGRENLRRDLIPIMLGAASQLVLDAVGELEPVLKLAVAGGIGGGYWLLARSGRKSAGAK